MPRGQRRLAQFADRVEQRLAESPYLAGDGFSLADITLLATVDYARWVDFDASAGRPHTADWYRRVSARPSAEA